MSLYYHIFRIEATIGLLTLKTLNLLELERRTPAFHVKKHSNMSVLQSVCIKTGCTIQVKTS